MTQVLVGVCFLAVSIAVCLLLRPRNGRERLVIRFPGAWIIVGLLLTISFAGSIAIILTGIL